MPLATTIGTFHRDFFSFVIQRRFKLEDILIGFLVQLDSSCLDFLQRHTSHRQITNNHIFFHQSKRNLCCLLFGNLYFLFNRKIAIFVCSNWIHAFRCRKFCIAITVGIDHSHLFWAKIKVDSGIRYCRSIFIMYSDTHESCTVFVVNRYIHLYSCRIFSCICNRKCYLIGSGRLISVNRFHRICRRSITKIPLVGNDSCIVIRWRCGKCHFHAKFASGIGWYIGIWICRIHHLNQWCCNHHFVTVRRVAIFVYRSDKVNITCQRLYRRIFKCILFLIFPRLL